MKWTAPSGNGSGAVTGYVVTPVLGSVAQAPQVFSSTATTEVVTGLANTASYTFLVAATNANGTGPTATTAPVTVGLPGAPAFPSAVGGNGSAKVSWWAASPNGSPVTGYVVTPMVGTVALAPRTFASTATSQVVSGLANGTAYTFRVAAVNAAGTGPVNASAAVVVGLPAAPTSPAAASGNASATVRWGAPSGNGSPITGYVVTPVLGSVAQAPQSFSSTATTEVVTGLTNAASYTFRVAAVNAAGTGPASATAAVTVGLPGSPPFPSAVPGAGAAKVSWWAANANGSAVTGYVVTPVLGSVAQPAQAFASTATSQTVTGLAAGSTYTFRIAAVNAAGTGAIATTGPVTVGAPGVSAKVTATLGAAGTRQATVTWSAPAANGSPITGYVVTPLRAGVAQPRIVTSTTATSLVVGALPVGVATTFTVAATNAIGTGPASSASNAVSAAPGLAGAPAAPTATAGVGSVTVGWSAPADTGGSPVTGYVLVATAGSVPQPPRFVSAATTSQVLTGLDPGTAYTFTVAATNAAGAGAPSAASSPVTPLGLPGAPTAVRTLAGNGEVTLSWTPPALTGGSPVTGYVVTPWVGGVSQPPVTFDDPSTMELVGGLDPSVPVSFAVQAVTAAGAGAASTPTDAVTPSPPPAPGPGTIDLVGDSILSQAFWNRDSAFDAQGRPAGTDVLKDALAGRQFQDVLAAERARIWDAARPAALVLALGTNNATVDNGGWTTSDAVAVQAMLDLAAPSTCVVVVLPGYAAQASEAFKAQDDRARAAIAAIAAARPDTPVVDWGATTAAHPELLGPDGIHLDASQALPGQKASPAAADAFAAAVWGGVAQCPDLGTSTGGLALTGLANPLGVAVDGAGTAYVADTSNGRVVSWTAGGVQQTLGFTGLANPTGIAVDPSGTVYVADTTTDRVLSLAVDGTQQVLGFTGLSNPVGVAVGPDGTVYVADTSNSRVVSLAPDGTQQVLGFTGLSSPTGVAVDATGTVYVADTGNGRVVSLAADGTRSTVDLGALASPTGLAVGPSGTLVVADAGIGQVVARAPDGTRSVVPFGSLSSPFGVAVGPDGSVYVADSSRSRIAVAATSGSGR